MLHIREHAKVLPKWRPDATALDLCLCVCAQNICNTCLWQVQTATSVYVLKKDFDFENFSNSCRYKTLNTYTLNMSLNSYIAYNLKHIFLPINVKQLKIRWFNAKINVFQLVYY